MSESFANMKKNRSVRSLSGKLDKFTTKKDYSDDRIWKPERDKSGNFSGIIRFLPAAKGEDDCFVKTYNHGFKKNGKWFIHNCPTTLGNDCPVCEANSELWGKENEADRKIASQRKRKISYYANIVVVKDPSNPENEGKNFLYRFGVKIFEKIQAAVEGDPALGEDGLDIQNFWEGADFVLKMRNNDGGFPTYEDSYFKSSSELLDGDEDKLREMWESLYPLQDFVDPAKYDSYEVLSEKFDKFVYGAAAPSRSNSENMNFNSNEEEEAPTRKSTSLMSDMGSKGGDDEPSFTPNVEEEDDDSPLAKFKKLAKD